MAIIEEIEQTSSTSSGVKPKMTEQQRQELADSLDKQLEEEMLKLEQKGSKYMDGWTEENWETEMEKHPFFATQNAFDGSQELSPLMKGIQDLKYSPDENSPAELANNYKEDGNFNFKCKKYRMAVISYSEGIRNVNIALKDTNNIDESENRNVFTLKAQLITNRAASQFRLGNYRSSLLDCRLALKDMPNHFKAIDRAVECCIKLNRHKECMEWCDKGLEVIKSESLDEEKLKKMQSSRAQAEKRFREAERNKRKEEAAIKKAKAEEQKLISAIQSRGIQIKRTSAPKQEETNSLVNMSDIEPCHPAALQKKVKLMTIENNNVLVWPVLFLYPEYGETDFIEEFTELNTINDHLELMFDQSEPAPWDKDRKYSSSKNINVYFEDARCEARPKLVHVDTNMSLLSVLSSTEYPGVTAGTPAFVLLAKDSPFEKEFLSKYK